MILIGCSSDQTNVTRCGFSFGHEGSVQTLLSNNKKRSCTSVIRFPWFIMSEASLTFIASDILLLFFNWWWLVFLVIAVLVGSFLGLETYCSYPEAAEEDLKKWERSYRKLSPAHKVIFCCVSCVQRQSSYCYSFR